MCDSHVPECEDVSTCKLHVLLYAGSRSSIYFKLYDELMLYVMRIFVDYISLTL